KASSIAKGTKSAISRGCMWIGPRGLTNDAMDEAFVGQRRDEVGLSIGASEMGADHRHHLVHGGRVAFAAAVHDRAHTKLFRFDESRQRRAERVDPLCLVTPGEEIRS